MYREKTTTAATRVYTNPRSRESANQEPNGEPLTDSKVRRQSGRFSCLRTPELFGRVSKVLFRPTTRSRKGSSHDPQSLTHATVEVPREFGSTEDRIGSIRETIHSSNVTRTGLATAVNVGFPTLCCVDRTTPRENQPPVSLSIETKGNARSSLILTIDLLRRSRHVKWNEGYKDDGTDGIPPEPQKPPQLPAADDDTQSRKFKLSRSEKWRILKNIGTVSIAFMVQFTAFQGTANLQSSINASDGLGTVSLSAIYAALVLSCIFVPTFLIKRLTVKWTLCLSMLCYAPYIGSQFYPKFYTLVPAGVLLGLGAAPMWAAKATYLTQVGGVYAKITDQPVDAIVVRFFGFFFLAWQTAELWGNLISSLVLSDGGHSDDGNSTTNSWDKIKLCGADFCVLGNGGHENLERPPESEIYEISSIYLTCVIVAVIIVALFVDPLSRYGEKQRRSDSQELSGIQLLSATAYQLKKPYQQLLIPITIWIGMEQAFIGADFTQAYISCALGIHRVGYVMICFGVVNAGCSLLFGSLMKFVGRQPLMALGAIVHASLIVVLLMWKPHPDNPYVFFSVSGLWGVGDAVWQTQVNGLYGTLFRRNKEAAFSNYRLWESAGFVIAYAYSTHLCARMKLYVMLTVLIVGTIGYIIVELLHRRKQRRLKAIAEDPKAAQAAAEANQPEETDDEKDDLDDEIIITHL